MTGTVECRLSTWDAFILDCPKHTYSMILCLPHTIFHQGNFGTWMVQEYHVLYMYMYSLMSMVTCKNNIYHDESIYSCSRITHTM